MSDLTDRIRNALADPSAPWYGSDLVEDVAELLNGGPESRMTVEIHRKVWLTREWGRVWVGCEHGRPKSGIHPVRICLRCFETVLRLAEASEK